MEQITPTPVGADPEKRTEELSDVTREAASGSDVTEGAGRTADRATRQAALWATLVALPITVAVGAYAFVKLSPADPAPAPTAQATAPRPQVTTPVEMAAPELAERPATVCRALLSKLPTTLRDLAQRPVSAGSEQNAAYGDPAVTVACGVPPATIGKTDEMWVVNRVCWHVKEHEQETVLTTADREVPVRVSVPREYSQGLQWVAPISESMVAAVPSAQTVPDSCHQ